MKTVLPQSQYNLGVVYEKKERFIEAFKWYRMAAEADVDHRSVPDLITKSEYKVAVMYAEGKGVARDIQRALRLFWNAAVFGDPRAIHWIREAAEQGDADAQNKLGKLVTSWNGNGVPQNYAEGLKWYQRAAEQGHTEAQHRLGLMYRNGNGVTQDHVEAVRWTRLAEQGTAQAQWVIGTMYDHGHSVPQDDAEALKWYRLAAEQKHTEAQHRLGLMYRDGKGVTEDFVEAYKWLNLAFSKGDENAGRDRDELALTLTPEQIAEAEGRIAKFKNKHPTVAK